MTPAAPPGRPDAEVVFDPGTYAGGVPFDALARLRRDRQIRDPATPQALSYVRQMMLNMDPPDASVTGGARATGAASVGGDQPRPPVGAGWRCG
jgi:hypothetical protein